MQAIAIAIAIGIVELKLLRAPARTGAVLAVGSHVYRGELCHQGRRITMAALAALRHRVSRHESTYASLLATACVSHTTHATLGAGGVNLPGENDSYDFGSGAGFYLNATQEPWSKHYHMEDYVVAELPTVVNRLLFPSLDATHVRRSVFGHSMGGHGALTLALRHADKFVVRDLLQLPDRVAPR